LRVGGKSDDEVKTVDGVVPVFWALSDFCLFYYTLRILKSPIIIWGLPASLQFSILLYVF
jgi:hypothetical protein